MMDNYSDEKLEIEYLQSPQMKFREIYDRYSGPLFRFLYRFTENNQVSEEILQDIFLEVINGSFKATENGSLKSWLFTVAKNRALNHRKKFSRTVYAGLDELPSDINIEEQTISRDLLGRLDIAEKGLPQEMKETWNLRKSGLDNQQIANKLSIPLGTVKSRFSRLVEYLRKEFDYES